jgi:small subunit ribosomal protein S1
VKNITEYGAFVDLGGIDGLLHITDMSWGRITHPSEMFQVGDEVEVVILKYDRERERVSLGYKQRMVDPWEKAAEKYPVYTRIRGKVVSLTDYGAFVELEEGIEGLIHVSEMSWTKRVKHPSKVVSVGDVVEAVVLDIDQEARRLSLGLKQTEPNPWEMIEEKYQVGTRIKGVVRNITDFGAFVEVEDGIDGLVHISDLSWDKKIKHPSDHLKKGDEVEAVILRIDIENQRLSLGIKQLAPSAYDTFFAAHAPGEVLEGTIVRFAEFGAFVEIEEGVEGLVHVSELSTERVEKPEDQFQIGQKVQVRILRLDPTERKIGLSIRAVTAPPSAATAERHARGSQTGTGSINLGDFAEHLRQEPKRRRKGKTEDRHEETESDDYEG